MAVRGALKRVVITGIHARRLFAMAAYRSEGGILAQAGYAVILRMIKIIAGHPALRAFIAFFQVYK